MQKITLERISYYMSAMILFNLFYIIVVLSEMGDYSIFSKDKTIDIEIIVEYTSILIAGVAFLWGIIYTCIICNYDFNTEEGEKGIEITIRETRDITAKEFFGKFSLLVLTGISIGGLNFLWKIIVYFIFYITIGIIYIRLDMIYLNPILILLRYKIFEADCVVNEKEKQYYFVLKDLTIKDGGILAITNTKKTIIRLKSKESKANEHNDKKAD